MREKYLTPFFVFFALCYISSLSFLPYSASFLVKVLPLVTLFIGCLVLCKGKLRIFLSIALFTSGTGDVFLALTINNAFIFGLGAFLVSHLFYTYTFFTLKRTDTLSPWRRYTSVLAIVYAVIMATYILPYTGDMFIPVTIYLIAITCMLLAALLSGLNVLVSIGALSFILSDSVLATGLFREPIIFSNYVVMISYYLAQYFIFIGLLKTKN
jgi:uncharacterized membrane protein YhhN